MFEPERRPDAASAFLRAVLPYFAPILAYFVVAAIWGFGGGGAAQREFFRAAATVIPTLLLTLAVQARYFTPPVEPMTPDSERRPRWLESLLTKRRSALVKLYAGQVLFILGLGEFSALGAIGSRAAPTATTTGFVAASIAAGFTAIGVVALTRRDPP